MGGTKHDQSKPAFHLIDARFDLEVIGAGDWQRGTEKGRDLRGWAAGNDGASIKRVFWYIATLYNTDNPQRTARLELARVLHFGAEKYSPNNWRGGFKWSRLWRAAYGHIEAHKGGDIYDEETGFLHLSHALCCLMFLIVHERDGLGEDDRAEIWPEGGIAGEDGAIFVAHKGIRFDLVDSAGGSSSWRSAKTYNMVRVNRFSGHIWPLEKTESERVFVAIYADEMRDLAWPNPVPEAPPAPPAAVVTAGKFVLRSATANTAVWVSPATNSDIRIERDSACGWHTDPGTRLSSRELVNLQARQEEMREKSWPSD